jgi:reactive intermediate/imine deaminase
MRREIKVAQTGPAVSHYTDAVRCGEFLVMSGMVAFDASGEVVGRGDVVAQTERIFQNLQAILTAERLSFADIARVTLYLRNIGDRTRINPTRQKYFGDAKPASTLVEISALVHPDLLLEIEAIAYAGGAASHR